MLKLTRFQWLVHLVSWIPLVVLLYDYLQGNLTANPIQAVEQRTGLIAISFLMASLACTPLHTLFSFKPALKVRRALGLYAFFYASLHFLAFFAWDYAANLRFIWLDIQNKLYIFVGAAALLILMALALTSTRASMKTLGKKWKQLHNLVYVAAILVIFHYIWAVKVDIRQPIAFAAGLFLLFIIRWKPVRRWIIQKRAEWLPKLRRFSFIRRAAPETK